MEIRGQRSEVAKLYSWGRCSDPYQKITLKMNFNQSENKKEEKKRECAVVAETNCRFQYTPLFFHFNC